MPQSKVNLSSRTSWDFEVEDTFSEISCSCLNFSVFLDLTTKYSNYLSTVALQILKIRDAAQSIPFFHERFSISWNNTPNVLLVKVKFPKLRLMVHLPFEVPTVQTRRPRSRYTWMFWCIPILAFVHYFQWVFPLEKK